MDRSKLGVHQKSFMGISYSCISIVVQNKQFYRDIQSFKGFKLLNVMLKSAIANNTYGALSTACKACANALR